jgi:hypothetical protein
MTDKKLYIFGDSFAAENMPNVCADVLAIMQPLLSYHTIIRDSELFSLVMSYAVGGSDFLSQYLLFLKYYNENDEFLFFETSPDRIQTKNGRFFNYAMAVKDTSLYIGTLPSAAELMQVKCYYEKFYDHEFYEFISDTLVNRIARLENVTVIPSFDTSTIKRPNIKETMCIVFYKENIVFNKYEANKKKYIDGRRNHMTETNHKIFADEILGYYTNKQNKINLTNFVEPISEPFEKYFKEKHNA